jgi:hypothetical protein
MGKARRPKFNSHQRVIDNLVEAVRKFPRAGDERQPDWHDWTWVSEYPDAQAHLRAAVRGVVQLKPTMLSEFETERALMIEAILPAVMGQVIGEAAIGEKCLELIQRLEALNVYTDLELPVMHVDVRRAPFAFGEVRFADLRPETLEHDQIAGWAYELFDGRITCVAQVRAPGDRTRQLDYAEERVQEALRTLMGALWPLFGTGDYFVPVVVGQHPQPSATPFRQVGSPSFEVSRGSFHRLGHWVRLPDHLEQHWGEDGLGALLGLASTGFAGSEMAERVASGLGWLGETAKPDILEARMVKVTTALEALVGGEPSQERFLTGRGIGATLAERAAFLIGETAEDRLKVHKDVSRYYGKRSDVLHSRGAVSREEVDDFGLLTWRVVRALVAKLDDLPTLAALNEWVFNQRYS